MKTILIIIFIICSNYLYSQIPQLISYQGVLTDNSGNLVSDGSYNLTFNLYTVSVGGSSIWTETQSVTTTQGVFNINLGSVTPFTIGFSSQYYLGVTIGGTEMSPRTQLTSAAYAMNAQNGNPPGTVLPYVGTSAPSGYLICDGSAVSRTTYPELFAIMGTSHGQGNGTTTFNLPDYRGRFLRGVDGSAGNDPDKATRAAMNAGGNTGNNVGSVQEDQVGEHQHKFQIYGRTTGIMNFAGNAGDTNDWGEGTTKPLGTTETRPKNAYVNYIIKY